MRRARQRNVAFSGQQARGGIQPNPAGTRQIDFAPGVQIREIDFGAAGAVERLHVGLELNQVARYKTGCQPAMAQQLHQQPSGIAARARTQFERLVRRLYAGFHADQVVDVMVHHLVNVHQKIDGAAFFAADTGNTSDQPFGERLASQVGRELLRRQNIVFEGEFFRLRLEEEIKRVVDRHVHHQIHRHLEFTRLFVENQTGQVV